MGVGAIGDAVQLRQQRRHLPGYGRRPYLDCEGIDGPFDDGCFRHTGGASQPLDLCDNNGICDLQRHDDRANVDLFMINIHQLGVSRVRGRGSLQPAYALVLLSPMRYMTI
jgi:hypothetical protein